MEDNMETIGGDKSEKTGNRYDNDNHDDDMDVD